jgi:membrane protease YdiL (CAAX protease family)
MNQDIKRRLVMFLILTFAISSVFYMLIARAGSMHARGGLYVAGLMWSPGVAALVTQFVTQGNLRGLGWRWGKTRYQLLSIGLPFLAALVTYGIVWLTGLGSFPNPAFVDEAAGRVGLEASPTLAIVIYVLVSSTFGLVTSSFTALGEEIGWRGLLVPALSEVTDFTKTSLISGAIWAIWHSPVILFADYHGNVPIWYALICFTVMAVAFSFIMAWIRLKSGSVWTAMFLHASHNLFVQGIFTPLTMDTGHTAYVIDEFGVGLALTYVAVAFVFWRMRGRLSENDVM